MKKLYLATFAILLASSCVGLLEANKTKTIQNGTSIPLSVSIKAKHQAEGKTKHDPATFLLAPAITAYIPAKFNPTTRAVISEQVDAVLAENGAGSHDFSYNGEIEYINTSDATDPNNLKPIKLERAHHGQSVIQLIQPLNT